MEFKELNSNIRLFLNNVLSEEELKEIMWVEGDKNPVCTYKIKSADIKGGRGFNIDYNGTQLFIDTDGVVYIEFDKWGMVIRLFYNEHYLQLMAISDCYEDIYRLKFEAMADGDYYENYEFYDAMEE